MKRIYRSKNEKMLAGVCGGIAQYFNIDPTLVRLLWAIISLVTTGVPGSLVYIVCAIVIPEEPDAYDVTGTYNSDNN